MSEKKTQVIKDAIVSSVGETPNRRARFIEHMLLASGYVILSPDEVQAIRNEVLDGVLGAVGA